jgi:hypothetical protein
MICPLGVQTRNIISLESGFTGRTQFIVGGYTVTKNGVPSGSEFSFQGNLMKLNRILECMRNVFTPTFYSNLS